MNQGPLRLRRAVSGAMARAASERAYFGAAAGTDVAGPLRKVLPPVPGLSVEPPVPGLSVEPPVPGLSVEPPVPGLSVEPPAAGRELRLWVGAAVGRGAAAVALPVIGEGMAVWLAARVDAATVATQIKMRREFKERMVFSCKDVSENDLAGAHLSLASRRTAELPGSDLPAAKAAVGERSMRDTRAGPPCQGSGVKSFGSTGIVWMATQAAAPAMAGAHG
jgi:hypothetical protein